MAAKRAAETRPDRALARRKLEETWQRALGADDAVPVSAAVTALIDGPELSIRFCLVTQVLGKATDPGLDALCLQKGGGSEGQWDPRSFASDVVVPWNRDNQRMLGGSGDPYVNNPLRRPRLDAGLENVKRKADWQALADVLARLESANAANPDDLLFSVLLSCARRLRAASFDYVVPPRVSLAQMKHLVESFLVVRSGGHRGMAVAAALMGALAQDVDLFARVERDAVNATDAAAGSAGDLRCIGADGAARLIVEVKERKIGRGDIEDVVAKARRLDVRHVLVCCDGLRSGEAEACEQITQSAWATGTSIYIDGFVNLTATLGQLLSETGKRRFVESVGDQLTRFDADARHKKDWADLLAAL